MGNARFQRKLKADLPYDPAIPLLGIYVKEMESPPHRDHVHCRLFTAKIWKHSRCPSPDERIKKMCYKYNGILFSLTKEGDSAICHDMDGHRGHSAL